MRIYKTRLAKTKYHTYIIRSDIEGADVVFDNQVVGQISNRIYYHKIKEKEDTGTHTVQLQNGTLPVKDDSYIFESLLSHVIDANGRRYNFINGQNIKSVKTSYTYSANNTIENLTIENNSCTINAIVSTQNTNVDFAPINYDILANETTNAKTHQVTLTQNESNKTLLVTINQSAGVEHTYAVNSDIEGASVIAGSETVGTISNGTCQFTKWNNKATDLSITLSGGTLVTKEDGYTFEVANPTSNVSADGGTFNVSTIVTSLVGSYTPKYPAAKICSPDNSVTMNTEYDYDTADAAYTVDGQVTFAENETTDAISREITITQTDTNQSETVTITQEAGIRHTYTILSDCEGATVNISGSNVGTISNGQFVYGVWNSKAPANVSASLTGGLPTAPSPDYSFSVSQSSLSFTEDGGTKNLTITSNKTSYSYSNTSGTCQRDSSVTCNAKLNSSNSNPSYTASESLSWITTSGNQVTASANSNYDSRSGSITYTQAESGKTDTVTVSQEAKTEYTYTVNSNCNGGTVYFNNVNKGTISNGRLTFTDEAASGTVRISGGVPSNSRVQTDTDYDYDTDTESDTDYDYLYNCRNPYSTSITLDPEAQNYTMDIVCTTATRTRSMSRSRSMTRSRPVYTNYNYSAPSNKTCQGNGSVTMNYTSSTSTSYGSYGSWSYGSWGSWQYGSWSGYTYSRATPVVTESLSWVTVTRESTIGNGSGMGYRYRITVTENSGSNTRSGTIKFAHPNSSSYYTNYSISQEGVEYVFKFSGSLGTHSANATTNRNDLTECGGSCRLISYKKVGNTYTRLGVSFASGGQPSQVYDYWAYGDARSGTNTGWDFAISCNQSKTMQAASGSDSYTVTMKQNESGKTANITIRQSRYALTISTNNQGTGGTIKNHLTWDAYTKNTNVGYHYIACQSGGNRDKWPNWIADSQTSWLGLNGGQITYTGGNGDYVFAKALSNNNSFSSRTGKFTLGIQGKTGSLGVWTYSVIQDAAPNQFSIKTSSGSRTVAISRSNVTSLPKSSIVTYAANTTAKTVSQVYISNTGLGNPFTSYGSQSFKIWTVTQSGSGMTATLLKTVSVSPGGTITI